MKRARAMLISFGMLLAVGCGMKNYDFRIEQTLDRMKYEKRLDENLGAPVAKGKLEELGIYIRPPKNLTGPTQTFQFAALEPGRFDVENTFLEPEKQSLHVLARVDRPKAAAKKGAAPQPEPPPRGDFNAEVVDLVRTATGAEVDLGQFKQENKQVKEKKQANSFLAKTISTEAKELQVYLYGSKTSPYKVALIFEYPTAEKNAVVSKIGLCLENFMVGDPARQAFSGGDVDESAEGGEGGEAGPPI
ncbi:hypothetical protein [Paludisphaera mucosa]|uniref:Lipoprotein n=1 Tax=Paludisphaera mucosa TaxID=3030827 RepID=A0ABT6F9Y9_9BACT|nr:hypothetical protein [Paludisphaera mucosa]MDG3004404.1 hypothetical protein [Paludisphaera mucosa]